MYNFRILACIIYCSLFLFLFNIKYAYAQDFKFCGTFVEQRNQDNQKSLKAPGKTEKITKTYFQSGNSCEPDSFYTIPVVFHIIHNNGPENISKSQVEDAVRILNEDFRKLNANAAAIIPEFKNIAADCQIEFRLARLDPIGDSTDGITRTVSIYTNLPSSPGSDTIYSIIRWPRDKYLNIWVVDSISGFPYGGWGTFPNSLAYRDGVVIMNNSIGSIGTADPSYQRLLTHYTGHVLNLHHLWGETQYQWGLASNCAVDDHVFDTPNTIGNSWSSGLYKYNCGTLDNVQNYMDFSASRYAMFTEGQKNRMWETLNSQVGERNNLWTCANLVATGIIDDTCTNTLPTVQTVGTLDINNISAGFTANGILFRSGIEEGLFVVPKGSEKHTIYTGGFWIGGLDQTNQMHLAATMFGESDFRPGPIMDSMYYCSEINFWNRVWKVNRTDIDYHIANWQDPAYVMPQVFIDWPAHGDASLGQANKLAPFYDRNSNGFYNPYDGDYPLIRGDQAIYFIFNDDNVHKETGGLRLKVEIHAMAYAFDCSDDSALYNTIFMNYNIYNRSSDTYTDAYIGAFMDFDIGGYEDDYFSSDVQRSSYFAYNGDDYDDDIGGEWSALGYYDYPPAQAITILAGPHLDADGMDNSVGIGANESINGYGFGDGIIDNERHGLTSFICWNYNINSLIGTPMQPSHYYNYLHSVWKDSTTVGYGGSGHYSDPACDTLVDARFMFPADSDPLGFGTGGNPQPSWSEETAGNFPSDRRGVGSTGPFTFIPGQKEQLDLAFVFGRNYNTTGAQPGVQVMKNRIDSIRTMFKNNSTPCGGAFYSSNATPRNEKYHFKIYPNPTKTTLFIELESETNQAYFVIYDVIGKQVKNGKLTSYFNSIDISQLNNGFYIIRVVNEKHTASYKILKY